MWHLYDVVWNLQKSPIKWNAIAITMTYSIVSYAICDGLVWKKYAAKLLTYIYIYVSTKSTIILCRARCGVWRVRSSNFTCVVYVTDVCAVKWSRCATENRKQARFTDWPSKDARHGINERPSSARSKKYLCLIPQLRCKRITRL